MSIALLTMTCYQSVMETRFHLACQMIGNAIAMGYKAIVLEGSSCPSIMEAFGRIGAVVHSQTAKGMGPARRELFLYALTNAAPFNLWTEEKPDIVRFIPQIVAPLVAGEADIVIASRTEECWKTYPAFQAVSEKEANAVYAEVTGRKFDPMFGPVAFTQKMARYFAKCNPRARFRAPDTYIHHIAPLVAMAEGARVVSVPVGFFYPSVQKAQELGSEEMREKRRRQFEECTESYRKAAKELNIKA